MLLNPYRFGSAPAPLDPYWSNVSCLLHFNGADTSTTITDEKGGSWAASSGAQIRTDISKFGGAALKLDGTDDIVSGPNGSAFTFGTGDFTIEFWFYCGSDLNGASGQKSFAAKWAGAGYVSEWILDYFSGSLRGIINDTSDIARVSSVATSFTAGNWYHIAWVRGSGTSYLFVDGVMLHDQGFFTHDMLSTSTAVTVGGKTAGSAYVDGRIDDFRITKGVARYTAPFTPPVAQFPDAAPPPPSATYWRINCTALQSGFIMTIAELELRATLGGADQCNGGTASGSPNYGGQPPSLAFDNTVSTFFATSPIGGPWLLQYQMPSPVSVAQFAITTETGSFNSRDGSPKDFTLESSEDGVSWTTRATVVGQTGWGVSETRVFNV